MTKKITRLTPEQEDDLVKWREAALEIACGGGRINRDALQSGLNDAYAEIGKSPPMLLIFDSPAAAMMAISVLKMVKDKELSDWLHNVLRTRTLYDVDKGLSEQIDEGPRDAIFHQILAHVWHQFATHLRTMLDEQLQGEINDDVRKQIFDLMDDDLRESFFDQISANLAGGVYGKILAEIASPLQENIHNQLFKQVDNSLSGLTFEEMERTLRWPLISQAQWAIYSQLSSQELSQASDPREDNFFISLRRHLGDQLKEPLTHQLHAQLAKPTADRVGADIISQTSAPLENKISNDILGPIYTQIYGHLRAHIEAALKEPVYDRISDALDVDLLDILNMDIPHKLEGELSKPVLRDIRMPLFDLFYGFILRLKGEMQDKHIYQEGYMWGSHDLYWITWARFAVHIGVKLEETTARRLDIMHRISSECEWWWPFDGLVIASQRPTMVKFDDSRRLHNESGPAVQYADGYSLYSFNGVRLPKEWVENRATIDPVEILKCENVEQRAAGAACIGWPRMLSALDYRTIDKSDNPQHGELIEIDFPGLEEPGLYLKAECPRNGTIIEGLPPVSDIDGKPIDTVIAAQAWRCGLSVSEFQFSPLRT